jgi:hypothetical protein
MFLFFISILDKFAWGGAIVRSSTAFTKSGHQRADRTFAWHFEVNVSLRSNISHEYSILRTISSSVHNFQEELLVTIL